VVDLNLVTEGCHCTIKKYIVTRIWIVLAINSLIEVELHLIR
jgi:hypothetical protein